MGFEIAGTLILVASGLVAFADWFRLGLTELRGAGKDLGDQLRFQFSHRIVLALEFFISADIIRSIQTPSFRELGKLGAIVVIRTVLHYSLR